MCQQREGLPWEGSGAAGVFLRLRLPLPGLGFDRVVPRVANGGPSSDSMCADPNTPERLGVGASLRRFMPSGRPDTNHALVPSLLQDSTDGVERLGFFSRGEQELAHPLPCFLQGFRPAFLRSRFPVREGNIFLMSKIDRSFLCTGRHSPLLPMPGLRSG